MGQVPRWESVSGDSAGAGDILSGSLQHAEGYLRMGLRVRRLPGPAPSFNPGAQVGDDHCWFLSVHPVLSVRVGLPGGPDG